MNRPSNALASATMYQPYQSAPLALETMSVGDVELEDLIYSWQRVSDPKLRKVALQLIRSMAS